MIARRQLDARPATGLEGSIYAGLELGNKKNEKGRAQSSAASFVISVCLTQQSRKLLARGFAESFTAEHRAAKF